MFLWATSWSGNSNEVDDPPAEGSWIWSRDPGADLIEDLAAVDAFDDGLITFGDNARLMRLRMAQAGIDVSLHEIDNSGYALDDDTFERVVSFIIDG